MRVIVNARVPNGTKSKTKPGNKRAFLDPSCVTEGTWTLIESARAPYARVKDQSNAWHSLAGMRVFATL